MKGSTTNNNAPRRSLAAIGTWSSVSLQQRNPFMVAFCSMTFAGFGHILIDKYFRGFILVAGEIFLNNQAHINQSIFYSLIGHFELAKEALNIKWMLLYIAVYGFSIYDSYRETVDINNNYFLALREDAEFPISVLTPNGLNFISKADPVISSTWSAILPGAGEFLMHKMNSSFFLLTLWIVSVYFSNLLPGIHYLFMGQLMESSRAINWQWFLNIPSIYFFSIYNTYLGTVETNRLFNWEQSRFIRTKYQPANYRMPDYVHIGEDTMYVIAEFKYSNQLEEALTALQVMGIQKEDILAVPMESPKGTVKLFDSLHASDGYGMLDIAFILAMIFTLLGSVFGFQLTIGPMISGVIGAVTGFLLGLGIKLLIIAKKGVKREEEWASDTVTIIKCKPDQTETVRTTLLVNAALRVGILNPRTETKSDTVPAEGY